MFIAALFTTDKAWKQCKCLWTEEWKIHTHTQRGTLHSAQPSKNTTICSNMDGPRDYQTKSSQKEKDKYHTVSLTYRNLKYDTNELL